MLLKCFAHITSGPQNIVILQKEYNLLHTKVIYFLLSHTRRTLKQDQSHQCYVTMCAGPSAQPCQVCSYTAFGEITKRCLKHSFVVHFKYDLLPPFPIFNPSTNLKMEGAVLFNTADFLMALRIITTESNSRSNLLESLKSLQLYPEGEDKKSCSPLDNIQYLYDVASGADIPYQCSAIGDSENPMISSEGIKSKVDCVTSTEASTSHNSTLGIKDEDMQPTCKGDKHLDRRKIVSGFVDGLNEIHGKGHYPHEVDKEQCLSPTAWHAVNKKECEDQHSLDNDDCITPKEYCDERKNSDKFDDNSVQTSKCSTNTFCSLHKTETRMTQSTCRNAPDNSVYVSQNSNEHSSFCVDTSDSNNTLSCDLSCPHRVPNACNSCGCSVLAPVLNNNNLTSSIVKVYIETDANYHELPDVIGEFDMFDGSLPLTVKTCHGKTLKQVFKINESNPNATLNTFLDESLRGEVLHVLAVQQVTLDLEQCINELIHAHEDLRHSYKSLKDYDVQVVGVCPDSGEVITMARLLVYTRQQSASFGLTVSPRCVNTWCLS